MGIAIPTWLALLLIGVGLTGTVLALIVTIRAYIQLRRSAYYVIREAARRTALRGTLLVFLFGLLTGGFLLLPRQAAAPQPTATAWPTQAPAQTPTRATPTPPATEIASLTPHATATEPYIPTSTAQPTIPAAFTSPLPSAVPPPGDARFEFWTLAQGTDANNQPVDATTEFPVGIERVYLFFRYDGLLPDVPWTTAWYHGSRILGGGSSRWESKRTEGTWHVFLEFAGGYPTGEYEVLVWLGDQLQIRVPFTVKRADDQP